MTIDRLRFDEFVPFAPDYAGEEVHIHHCKPGANNDRLYIRRTDDDRHILAFCHHCGKSGYYTVSTVPSYKTKDNTNVDGTNVRRKLQDISLPFDFDSNTSHWPREARVWCSAARIGDSDIKTHGIGYSAQRKRVILPCYSATGTLKGYQERRVFTTDPKPKYVTRSVDKQLFWEYNNANSTITIVEDILSAIRISKYTDSIALLRANVPDYIYKYIIVNNYINIIIWLDNDNYIVNKNKLIIKNKLDLLFDNVKVINIKEDPKNLPDSELEKILL